MKVSASTMRHVHLMYMYVYMYMYMYIVAAWQYTLIKYFV
jgi:hypothetical protein